MKVQLTPLAQNDLKEIRTYITNELLNPTSAVSVVKRITTRIRELAKLPAMGATLSSIVNIQTDYRFLVCGNYTAFYRYDDKFVYIIRVLYHRRDFVKILFGNVVMDDDESED